MKTAFVTALFIGVTCLESQVMASAPAPATILVTTRADNGPGSLRVAIRRATPGSTIKFNFPGVISLTTGELLIDKNLTIVGPGSTVVTVRRDPRYGGGRTGIRLVEVTAGVNVNISGLTFSGGYVTDFGGGILNHGRLTLSDVRIADNAALLFSGGLFELEGDGGGCVNAAGAEMSLTNCTIAGNICSGSGGGILNFGTLTLKNSTISDNQAPYGGGVDSHGSATLTNCTISGNQAVATGLSGGYSGGLALSGSAVLLSDTISANSCVWQGGGIFVDGVVDMTNCILAGNSAESHPENADVVGSVHSVGYNLIGVAPPGSRFGVMDLTGTPTHPLDPMLGPLQHNGGPTLAMALVLGSPAIDKGVSQRLTTDQRGMPRTIDQPLRRNAVDGNGTDIGAFELAEISPFLANASTRARVETGDNVLIAGFMIRGVQPKQVMVRAIGPSLPFAGALADPVLD